MNNISIAIIGGGNMGQAIAKGISRTGRAVFVKTPNPEKLHNLQNEYPDITVNASWEGYGVSHINYVLLAVKPHKIFEVIDENEEFLKKIPNLVIVSVAAGIEFADMQKKLSYAKVIRSMPNTPVAVGQGLVGYYALEKDTDFEEGFSSLGQIIYLEKEEKIHIFTAVAGSGPAYIFHIMEAMSIVMQEHGFNESESLAIIKQLFLGTADLANTNETPTVLREKVTSPKGTTYAGLLQLMNLPELNPQSSQMVKVFEKVLDAASKRSIELAKS